MTGAAGEERYRYSMPRVRLTSAASVVVSDTRDEGVFLRRLIPDREGEHELRSLSRFAGQVHAPAVFSHDALADGEAQAGAVLAFRGEEAFEDLVDNGIRDAGPRILDHNSHVGISGPDG